MTDRPRALAVLVAVFLFGCILGSAGSYMWLRNRPITAARTMQGFQRGSPLGGRRISEFLKLTPEQDARFREIMAESFRELGKLRTKQEPIFRQLDQLRQEQEPQLEAIRTETNRKLMTILNEEQKKKFSEFLKETENWRGHPPHGGRGMEPSPPPQGFRDGRQ